MNIFEILIILSFISILHEAGHFLVSKVFGLTPDLVRIGFGKVILTKNIMNTSWEFSLIPLGGYVRNMTNNQDVIKNISIAFGGPLINILLAIICIPIYHIYPVGIIYGIYFINILLAIINLIPIGKSDGYQIMMALLKFRTNSLTNLLKSQLNYLVLFVIIYFVPLNIGI